ncbi:hypothetical protein KQI65_02815 [bacterium]|nr:hypothetical protein [bacterium]
MLFRTGMKMLAVCCGALIFLLPGALVAQPELEFSGYVVDLPMYQRLPDYSEVFGVVPAAFPADRNMSLNLTRLRLRPILRMWEGASLSLEHEMTLAVSSQNLLFEEGADMAGRQVVDLRWRPVDKEHVQLQHFVDRLYFRQNFVWGSIIAGRQRISWGTGRIWNPTDLFNPINPLSFDKIEKDGADALSFKYYIGNFTDLQFVVNPKKHKAGNYAMRFRSNVDEFDLSAMGGWFDDRPVFGGDFAGNLFDAGVRGEFIYSGVQDETDAYVRFILGADYQLTSKLYLVTEYLHNGEGAASPGKYDVLRLFRGEILNLGRDYMYLGGTYKLHPLVVASFGGSTGLGDGSGYISLNATWSTSDNSSLTAGMLLPWGEALDEYWYYPSSLYLQGDFYF